MSDFFDLYFYWLGVATAVVFALIGYCVVCGLVVSWAWDKCKDVYGMTEVISALHLWRETKKEHKEMGL